MNTQDQYARRVIIAASIERGARPTTGMRSVLRQVILTSEPVILTSKESRSFATKPMSLTSSGLRGANVDYGKAPAGTMNAM